MRGPAHMRIAILDRIVEILEGVEEITGGVTMDVAGVENPSDLYEVSVVWVSEPSDPVEGNGPQPTNEAEAATWMNETVAPIAPIDQRAMLLSIEIVRSGRDLRSMIGVEAAIQEALFGPDVDWRGTIEGIEYQGSGVRGAEMASKPFLLCAIAVEVSYATMRGLPGVKAF